MSLRGLNQGDQQPNTSVLSRRALSVPWSGTDRPNTVDQAAIYRDVPSLQIWLGISLLIGSRDTCPHFRSHASHHGSAQNARPLQGLRRCRLQLIVH